MCVHVFDDSGKNWILPLLAGKICTLVRAYGSSTTLEEKYITFYV